MKITSFIISFLSIAYVHANIPIVINTWNFTSATKKAWELLKDGKSARDAITHGCAVCEVEQCDGTVGYGGSPDENGETTLDAMIFDGTAMDMGAVGGLRRIKNAIAVAREVLEHTEQSFLVGDLATAFAKCLNYEEISLSTNHSLSIWEQWKNADNCQPNFWKNVVPDPRKYCGPYESIDSNELAKENEYGNYFNSLNHDTIGMIIIDTEANVVVGTSTNGATHKIPGRVGDSPIPGAGAYADSDVGGAVATGDGDVMMRFLPSFLAVEEMRRGASPSRAAQEAIFRIVKKYPNFFGGVIAVTKKGEYGAACNGMDSFPFSLGDKENDNIKTKYVSCVTGKIY